jgi:hypothetical protein
VGTLKVGVYTFDPAALTLTRKGDISLAEAPARGALSGSFHVARTADGSGYPLLAALYTDTYVPATATSSVRLVYGIRLYSLKNFLDNPAPASIAPAPDATLPPSRITFPLSGAGQVIMEDWPYHVFLRREGAITNLYLYRQAYVLNGKGGDAVLPYGNSYDVRQGGDELTGGQGRGVKAPSLRSLASLRVDRIAVTGLTGGTVAADPTNPNPTNPGPVLIFRGTKCLERYRYLCDQFAELTKRICAIAPRSCIRNQEP